MGYTNRSFLFRLSILILGLSLFSLGIVITVNANIGLSPWDIFHQGLSKKFNITMGQASLIVGLIIIIINFAMKEKVGIGTILNVFLISFLMDLLFKSGLIPIAENWIYGSLELIIGLLIIGLASYFYLCAGLGAGPRDGIMVVLTKKTGIDVAIVRNSIEIAAAISGYLLGGKLGLGTVICALTVGFFVKLFFNLFKTDIKAIKHDYLDLDGIRNMLKANNKLGID